MHLAGQVLALLLDAVIGMVDQCAQFVVRLDQRPLALLQGVDVLHRSDHAQRAALGVAFADDPDPAHPDPAPVATHHPGFGRVVDAAAARAALQAGLHRRNVFGVDERPEAGLELRAVLPAVTQQRQVAVGVPAGAAEQAGVEEAQPQAAQHQRQMWVVHAIFHVTEGSRQTGCRDDLRRCYGRFGHKHSYPEKQIIVRNRSIG